jgi:hypothetical protein
MSIENIIITALALLAFVIGYRVEKSIYEKKNWEDERNVWPF